MTARALRDWLESGQIAIYFGAGLIALMLFVTFLQVSLAELGQAFARLRFLAALLVVNFIAVPLLVAVLIPFAPDDALIRLGVLLVLLYPCIDYVVTFAHLGRADARLLLASTSALLIFQMLLLPLYLHVFLGATASRLIQAGPFLHAFLWLIVIPLAFAIMVQLSTKRSVIGQRIPVMFGLLPVPATALVLFTVIAAVVPQLGPAANDALRVTPVYVAFAVFAPLLGWAVSRATRLKAEEGRALAFSAATRNSLFVLPLALAVPGAVPLLPAIIVVQTLVELIAELIFIRFISGLGAKRPAQRKR